jgi:hypothetical protein
MIQPVGGCDRIEGMSNGPGNIDRHSDGLVVSQRLWPVSELRLSRDIEPGLPNLEIPNREKSEWYDTRDWWWSGMEAEYSK